jgi:predicted DNA-binding transcriptional regulator YafY
MSPRNTFAASRRSHAVLKWLQSGRAVKIQDVMDEFGIQYPQARADLKLLEELYGLSTHRDGRTKVWTWSGVNSDYIDVATAASLELGAIALDLFKGTPYGEEIERFAEHSRSKLKDSLRARVERLSKALHLRRTWLPVHEDRVLDMIEQSIDALFVDSPRWLLGRYERSLDEVEPYIVLPQRMIWYQGRLWLMALHGMELKLFDVAGFETLDTYRAADGELDRDAYDVAVGDVPEGTTPPLERGPEELADFVEGLDDEPESFFEDSFGIYAGEHYPVRPIHLEVSSPWITYLNRYRLHPSQENERDGDSLHVRFEMNLCPEFRSFVMGMLPHVEVHEPAELRQSIEDRVETWLDRTAQAAE